MDGGNTSNSNFISNCINGMMDEVDPRKEIIRLINFDGAKVVQVAGELLEIDHPKNINILCTLHGGNTGFYGIGWFFQCQMRISFPLLRAKELCRFLLIMRTRSFLLSCT